ncbi:molybdopterin-dependent oxidoreductase [Caballeronia sp. GACF5]|uniref:molybdopterin-dependent oxidoreductase n=1 Tax=Caballeronia sp. GACF5 TaxID=2921746 RepID=UPI002027FA31|nr:molybdopterin-dependent oxidoreductase [Caballeronia sp. GACF5]
MGDVRKVSHCSHWGAYTISVEGGKILDIEPSGFDPTPSPIIHSTRIWADPYRRILSPMIRRGWLESRDAASRENRGNDQFVPVSWPEATKIVASEIDRVRNSFGNESIFAGSYGWASAGRFHHSSTLLKRMLNLLGGYTGHVDTYSYAAGPVILRHVLGSTEALTGRASTLDTVADNTETFLIFGSLSPRTAQVEAGGLMRRSLESNLRRIVTRNTEIIHVSPLRDDVPDWAEAKWWAIRPNTDTALLIGLAGEIVKNGRENTSFLQKCCSGSAEFLTYLRGHSDGVEKNAAWASGITEIPAPQIRQLAERVVKTRTMISMSWSLQRAQYGEQPYWAALGLAAVIGQIGLPGGGLGYGYASVGGVGGPISIGKNPAISAGPPAIDSFIPVARIADMLLNPGGSYTYEGKVRTYPHARLVYWAGGNPFHHHQDLNRLNKAWKRPETIIVQDPYFTATALNADIVLPATTSIERNDIAANGHSDMLVAMQKAIEPLGMARSDFEIFADIAAQFNLREQFTESRGEMEWLAYLYEDARAANKQNHDHEMPDFETFWRRGWATAPALKNYTYLAKFREDPEKEPLRTESGRIVLHSSLLAKLDYQDCRSHPAWIEPREWLGSAKAEDMFHLISNQPPGRLHSQTETAEASLAQKRGGREAMRISPSDATLLSINTGDTVRIWNERGACLATAVIDPAVRTRVVVLPTGAWLTQRSSDALDLSGNPNVLTQDIPASSFSQGCAAHTCLVAVERYTTIEKDAITGYDEKLASVIGHNA